MPRQDTTRPDRKRKCRQIVCVETGAVYANAHELADAIGKTTPHIYNVIRLGHALDGLHYNWMPDRSLIETVCDALNEQDTKGGERNGIS